MYLWLKTFHIIFMVAWFAGLFYIFRLFVYHVKFRDEAKLCQAYALMEAKLLHIIMYPASLLTLLLGVLLISQNPTVLEAHWFYGKLFLVLLLFGYQFLAAWTHRRLVQGDFFLSEKACRLINEVPTLLLIGIIILVVVKPSF